MSDFEIVQVNFRMPKELKDKLEKAAHESGRSITSELVTRLEQSFAQDQPTHIHMLELNHMLDKIMRELQELKKPTA